MPSSRRLYDAARKVMPSGVNSPVRYYSPHPFFVARAKGGHIWSAENKRMLDLCNGYGALLLGHARREVVSAVSRQLGRGTLYCAPTAMETELASMVSKHYPSMRKVRLVNTGGEATMTAIRLARGHTGRKKIVKFEGCYHGAHDSVLVRAGSGSAHSGIPVSKGGLDYASRQTLVARYNDFGGIERVLEGDGDIAGVIIEPIMANMGLVLPAKGFLAHVRKLTSKHGIPLIFDEVVTGFRVSMGGAQAHFGIRPDITTLAKALGGGFGIAAVGGSRKIMDNLSPAGKVYQASTFAGNPVAVSAALASIKAMAKAGPRMYPRLERYCARLAKGIDDIATDLGIPHQINFASSMMQVFFTGTPVTDHATSAVADGTKFRKLFLALLKAGVFVAPSQYETVFLSDAHTAADMDAVLGAYGSALGAVKR